VREAFEVWDSDGSGSIEASELKRVLKALDPNFADRDVNQLIQTIDKNRNGIIDYDEFCEWIMQGDPLAMQEGRLEDQVAALMQAAGKANNDWQLDIAEVHLRQEGIFFVTEGGEVRLEATGVSSSSLELAILDPEQFITKVEATEAGLLLTMNTGHVARLGGSGQQFGPYEAEEGFHIVGLRTKPTGQQHERIVGVDTCPLAGARSFSVPAALRFAAERELLQTLRELLTKAAGNVNAFGRSGVTPLMLAAQHGNVGAMRLLLMSKANPNICDEDGWTALTFGSRCGQTDAVSILLQRGAKQEGDGGSALSQALRGQHNSSARALLRAGFGPAPKGTFAIEEAADATGCTLAEPAVSPPSGNYTQGVSVRISHEDTSGKVRLFFTLDGRDPYRAGRRYRGPVTLADENNHVRVVAVRGTERSAVLDLKYNVCHCAMPDEMVSGMLRVRTFPEVQHIVVDAFSKLADVPPGRLLTEVSTLNVSTGKCWVRVPVSDPRPEHRLKIDRSYTLVRSQHQRKAYLDKFVKDVQKATGARPEDMEITAGSILLDFTLPRAPAEELVRQLGDPTSFLLTKAKLKASFADAEYQRRKCVGDRVNDPSMHSSLHASLGRKATVDEVMGIGEADDGVVALCCPEKQVKKLREPLAKAVFIALKDLGVDLEPVRVCPEECELSYRINVVNGLDPTGAKLDGGTVVKKLNNSDFPRELVMDLVERGLSNPDVKVGSKATSRQLTQLEVLLKWDQQGSAESLDGICMVYEEENLMQIMSLAADNEPGMGEEGKTRQEIQRCRSISRAVQRNGESTRGQHLMTMDLAALPPEVTDMYFVLAASGGSTLRTFPEVSVQIQDAFSKQVLTEYRTESGSGAEAMLLCRLSRTGTQARKWILRGLGAASGGSAADYEPLIETVAGLQAGYLRWERREDLVKLRVLHKLGRMSQASTSNFALFLQGLLELPVPVFQLVVLWL